MNLDVNAILFDECLSVITLSELHANALFQNTPQQEKVYKKGNFSHLLPISPFQDNSNSNTKGKTQITYHHIKARNNTHDKARQQNG
jgi:hypothetical protein